MSLLKRQGYLINGSEIAKGGIWFKYDPEEDGGAGIGVLTEEEEGEISDEGQHIRCGQCMGIVTHPENRVTMHGAHRHTFANPHGIVYEIGLFQEAVGCRYAGPPTDEFSWFKGYAWRIAVCKNCLVHLGWLFDSPGKGSFNGLIIDRLVFPEK